MKSSDTRNKAIKKWNTNIKRSKTQKTMEMALRHVQGLFQQ